MGRNVECFCGSGLKIKKCHSDIDEQSRAARLLKTYNEIEVRLNEYYRNDVRQPPCKPGCSDCCYDYFTVSDVEYGLITREIQNWKQEDKEALISKSVECAELFRKKHPSIFKYFDDDQTGSKNIFLELENIPRNSRIPCVFLDDESNKCRIYKVRPKICRIHGVSHYSKYGDNLICEKVGLESNAKSWLADFSFLNENEYLFEGMYLDEIKTLIKMKGYPLFYWNYYNLYVKKNNFKIVLHDENFKIPERILLDKYRRYILSSK